MNVPHTNASKTAIKKPLKKILIKIGGTFISTNNALSLLFSDIAEIQNKYKIVIVHGGGVALSDYSVKNGCAARFTTAGLRITSTEEMLYADRILSGQINTHLVRFAVRYGIQAVGLTGGDASLIVGKRLYDERYENNLMHTGTPDICNTHILSLLTGAHYVPYCMLACSNTARHGTKHKRR